MINLLDYLFPAIYTMTMLLYQCSRKSMIRICKSVLCLLIACVFTAASADAEPDIPFAPGERLVFELQWSFIKAGEAVLEVLPPETINGVLAHHFRLTAESAKFIDYFYKVRDKINAFADMGMTRSLLYKKEQREGKTRRNVMVRFDWEKQESSYTNFGKSRKPVKLLEGTFDPLSAFYYSRMFDPSDHKTIKKPITDGKKCVVGEANIIRKERITVRDKTYDTYLIEPDLKHVGGVFQKSKNAKIQVWITADARRIPVRLASEVIVGSFVGELVSAEGLKEIP